MQLTFSPALGAPFPWSCDQGSTMPLKTPSQGDIRLACLVRACKVVWYAGGNVDRPALEGRAPGEWGAVPFTFHESRDEESGAGHKVLSLPSPAKVSATSLAVYAELPLRLGGYRSGHRFSFTYRLVYASGEVRWLGAFGQNGTLVVSHQSLPKALGIALKAGWQTRATMSRSSRPDRRKGGKSVSFRTVTLGQVGSSGGMAGLCSPPLTRQIPALLLFSSPVLVVMPLLRFRLLSSARHLAQLSASMSTVVSPIPQTVTIPTWLSVSSTTLDLSC
ncbi:uncharacterized protein B0H18DRAFT_198376 [Fomitopsis serialis]|uniref:uncharacterized protein n=1 Tax=Fomitopsis serialis TaxID=139415 RepID=UPI00200815D7|nr:uncharacterized protein B0H18DRAFT_198376 [Neoantrodia serialis]KAH9937454.1 hypothetical protein B0H18DRAFT_198376 [Neoantrodia serialis]